MGDLILKSVKSAKEVQTIPRRTLRTIILELKLSERVL